VVVLARLEMRRPHVLWLRRVRRRRVRGLGLALPLPSPALSIAGGRLGRARSAAHHPEEQEDTATDDEDLQEADTTAEAVTEQHAAEEPAERKAGETAHEAGAPPGALWLRLRDR